MNLDLPVNMPISSSISSDKCLSIGGCDVSDLVREYGTPLWVLDELTVRDACQSYMTEFKKYDIDVDVVYASKASSNIAVLQLVSSEGLGVDVVSGGELYTALAAKVDPSKIIFHGNNKSELELREAVEAGVGRVVIDNEQEDIWILERAGVK